jgi:hypothetical protein
VNITKASAVSAYAKASSVRYRTLEQDILRSAAWEKKNPNRDFRVGVFKVTGVCGGGPNTHAHHLPARHTTLCAKPHKSATIFATLPQEIDIYTA